MVQTLEAIKGGGGSIKVGTIGTVGSLMTRELESVSSKSQATSSSSGCNPPTVSESHVISSSKSGASLDEASSSITNGSSIKHRSPENTRKFRGHTQHQIPAVDAITPKRQKQRAPPLEQPRNGRDRNKTNIRRSPDYQQRKTRTYKRSNQIPMLGAENMVLEKTPIRDTKKGGNIVDIVDVNCGSPRSSLSNRLKKLGFSKLSQSII